MTFLHASIFSKFRLCFWLIDREQAFCNGRERWTTVIDAVENEMKSVIRVVRYVMRDVTSTEDD